MTKFESAGTLLGDVDAEAAGTLVAAAADVALIVNGGGVIRDVALGNDLNRADCAGWLGRPWTETVTVESRPKVEALLRDAAPDAPTRWRHVNHASPSGPDLPVMYSAIKVGATGRVLAIGRDLRAVQALQQRLVEAQQSMERDYARLRNAEARYRLLFQTTADAVLIVDASTQKVMDANPAAARLLGEPTRRVVGRMFPDGFDPAGTQAIQDLLARVRVAGRGDDVRARLADTARETRVSASVFREDGVALMLVRLYLPGVAPAASDGAHDVRDAALAVIERAPDAFALTTPEGRILYANAAFLDLVQLANPEQALGQPIERWIGRPGVDLGVLTANLRQHGNVRLYASTATGEFGMRADVEISAVAVVDGALPCLGFAIRDVGRRLPGESPPTEALSRSAAQMTELVGRVPLKELVRQSTDVIERLCIEAALTLTHDNRALAAEMLGLSRQSLYVKMHRYGLRDLAAEDVQ